VSQGLPGIPDMFRAFGDRRGSDRTGLGLGLSISRKAVAADGGEIRALNCLEGAESSPSICPPASRATRPPVFTAPTRGRWRNR